MKALWMSTALLLAASAAQAETQGAIKTGDGLKQKNTCECSYITHDEVKAAQKKWAEGIEKISQTYMDKGDYKQVAKDLIKELYNYGHGDVLFKPTLASDDKFRETFDQALSYFVTGVVEEDQGFAIKPWSDAHFGKQLITTTCDSAMAMGKYYFKPADGSAEVGVEYSFGYVKDDEGNVRINLHHSSLPYGSQ